MNEKKRSKFLSKTATFAGKTITLWSLDGVTWSTRKEELQIIHDRHEAERLKTIQHIGEVLNDERTRAQKAEEVPPEAEPEVEPDVVAVADDEELDEDEEESDDDAPVKKKTKAPKAAGKAKPAKKKPARRRAA